MFSKENKIKLIDFGLSQSKYDPELPFAGTPNYLAPEVLKHTKYDKSIDYWSLGCLMYQMVIGRPPFKADTKHHLYEQIVNDDPEFPEDIDSSFKDLVTRLLNKEVFYNSNGRANIDQIVNKSKSIDFSKPLIGRTSI